MLPRITLLAGDPRLSGVLILLGGTTDATNDLFFGLIFRLGSSLLSFLAAFLDSLDGLIEGIECLVLTFRCTDRPSGLCFCCDKVVS